MVKGQKITYKTEDIIMKTVKRENFGKAVICSILAFVCNLAGTALAAAFPGEEAWETLGGILLIGSWVLTIVAYMLSGGIRATIKASFGAFIDFATRSHEERVEDTLVDIKSDLEIKGYTYQYKVDRAESLGLVWKALIFLLWITCYLNFPIIIVLSVKNRLFEAE